MSPSRPATTNRDIAMWLRRIADLLADDESTHATVDVKLVTPLPPTPERWERQENVSSIHMVTGQ